MRPAPSRLLLSVRRRFRARSASAHEIEETLLKHLFETLLNSPHVDRIESQLLLHPSGVHAGIFHACGVSRFFAGSSWCSPCKSVWSQPRVDLPHGLELRTWRDEDLTPAGRLISEAYREHPDSVINDQYRSVHGSQRFLHNIVRYSGCGTFSRAGFACGGEPAKPRNGGAGAGFAGERAERPHHAALRPSRSTGATGWRGCCCRSPRSTSCATERRRFR